MRIKRLIIGIFILTGLFLLIYEQADALSLEKKITYKLKRNIAEDTDPPFVDLFDA
ncbi:MAG: hypothetical protein ACD_68C00126G0002, partial [uncultured bacterium]